MTDTEKCGVQQAAARFNALHDATLDWHRASAIHSGSMNEANYACWKHREVQLKRLRTQAFRIMCARLARRGTL